MPQVSFNHYKHESKEGRYYYFQFLRSRGTKTLSDFNNFTSLKVAPEKDSRTSEFLSNAIALYDAAYLHSFF